ncbi:hypothetical protein [Cupriavidus pampae]|uniref:Uncharacterized protein n=1 Tax=Cupriavidus pampae TaxID=659251 RepID=A0ABN7ZDB8_9BURK|nr:hypothetical protein [Cupriavidus pampae]CAG9183950.1 hypothetical protein LMG32289_05470 [Cupriavidus pampae]
MMDFENSLSSPALTSPAGAARHAACLAAPVSFCHETSPAVALRILRTLQFVAGPILGDAGLSGALPGSTYGEQAILRGAVLHFEWTGPVSAASSGRHEPYLLYDERPHRLFVFVGTQRYLQLRGVTLADGLTWADAVAGPARPNGVAWLNPRAWRDWLFPVQARTRQARMVGEEVARRLAETPTIRIVPPARAPYLGILRARGLL